MAAPHEHKAPKPKEPTNGDYVQTVELIHRVVFNQHWSIPKAEMAQALDNVKGKLDEVYAKIE